MTPHDGGVKKVLRLRDDENAFVTTRHFDLFLKNTEALADPDYQKKFLTNLNGGPRRFVYLDQVHGSRVALVDAAGEGFTRLDETDAVITNLKDLGLIVMTADCLSVFFHAGDWVGLAHAGWRGTQNKIAAKTLQTIVAGSGCGPEAVKIIFGPSIRACHYEVGEEFRDHFGPEVVRPQSGKLIFDLAGENKKQLVGAGVREENISDPGLCTVCQNRDFYSHRLEKGSAGRMISWVVRQ